MGLSLYSTIGKDPISRKKIKRYAKYTKGVKWQNSRKSTKKKSEIDSNINLSVIRINLKQKSMEK